MVGGFRGLIEGSGSRCQPRPLTGKTGDVVSVWLMSDLHLGASNVDYDRINQELADAKSRNSRILINGDLMDLILPKDHKRYVPDVLLDEIAGRRDVLNASVKFAVKILKPYAHLIDMIGMGNHECFNEETECLTDQGWVPFRDITKKSNVASYRIDDGGIEFSKPLQVHKYLHDGELATIRNQHVDLAVTLNHRMLIKPSRFSVKTNKDGSRKRRPGEGGVVKTNQKWRAVKSFNGKIKSGPCRATYELAEMDIPNLLPGYRHDMRQDGWRLTEAESLPKSDIIIPCAGVIDSRADLTELEIRLAAWVITDGCLGKKGAVHIYQRVSKAHMVRDLLKAAGAEWSERVREPRSDTVCGRKLKNKPENSVVFHVHGEWRKRLKEIVPNKDRLPHWVWECSKDQFDKFLSSYIDGDGSRHHSSPDTSLMVYGRRHLMDDLQATCAIHGYRSTLSEYRPGSWRLNVNPRQMTSIRPSCIGREQYQGMVYCVTTVNDTVVVRRRGKVAVTGNSAVEKYHAVDPMMMVIDELQRHAKHKIVYGSYNGFIDYRISTVRGNTPRGSRLVIFYHHGGGGSAPVTKGMIDFNRLGFVQADIKWIGHKHNRFHDHERSLECPLDGHKPVQRDIRHIMTGSYMETYAGQSQDSIFSKGRRSNYAGDMAMRPQGKGGWRLDIKLGAADYKLSINEDLR